MIHLCKQFFQELGPERTYVLIALVGILVFALDRLRRRRVTWWDGFLLLGVFMILISQLRRWWD